jgi:hypothetical protein
VGRPEMAAPHRREGVEKRLRRLERTIGGVNEPIRWSMAGTSRVED